MTKRPLFARSETQRPPALVALFAVVALVAFFAYVISAWQVYGFARHVWKLPLILSFAAAVVSDLLSLSGLFSTYLLRAAHWRVRAYAWTVFLLMTALSILAAESFSSWRRLSDARKDAPDAGHLDSQIASGAIVVALTLAVHLLIVTRRHTEQEQEAPAEEPAREAPPKQVRQSAPEQKPQVKAEVKPTPPPARPVAPRPTRPALTSGKAEDPVKATAVRQILAGEKKPAEVAAELGKNKRTVELWVAAARTATPPATPVQSAPELPKQVTVLPAAPPVNGHATPAATPEGGPRS